MRAAQRAAGGPRGPGYVDGQWAQFVILSKGKPWARIRLWAEQSALRACALAVAGAAVAATCQWLIEPLVHARVPFLFFLPTIILASVVAGPWGGYLVVAAGLVNALAIQAAQPVTSTTLLTLADSFALGTYVLTGTLMVVVGHLMRQQSRQELADITALHELSNALATAPGGAKQFDMILQTLVRLHGADRGLLSRFQADSNVLNLAASVGFSDLVSTRLRSVSAGEGACGLACLERRRVVIEDVEADSRFAEFRDLAHSEHFRAVHSTPILSRTGEILGALSVHFGRPRRPTDREIRLADLCAQKAAFLIERERAEAIAERGDKRFRAVLEASSVPLAILRPVCSESGATSDFAWIYVNSSAARAIGRPPEALTGKRVSDVLPGTWDEPGLLGNYAAVLEDGRSRVFEVNSTTNGVAGWYHVIASPLDGDLAVWFMDITERREREQRLHEADRRKDEFLATLAHELRNPLAPIRQAAAIASKDNLTEAQRRWSCSIIERQVQHMSLLLDDLLDVSRITRGTLHLREQRTQLQSILGAAIDAARPLMESRHHRFSVDAPAGLEVNGDPLRLAQIFSNLLTNAAKYTPPGGEIRCIACQRDEQIAVSIHDNGIGIERQDLPKIFQMFAQLGSSPEHAQGLGIGLALAKGLVELHGGRIEAHSEGLSKGSTFTVLLPLPSAQAPAGRVAESSRVPRLKLSRRILVADDNRDAAESMAVLLRMDGHTVHVCHDGESALEAFRSQPFDAALIDLGMPRVDGYDFARWVRDSGSQIPLIALTGRGQESDRKATAAAGFDQHLVKPVDLDQLSRLLSPAVAAGSAAGGLG